MSDNPIPVQNEGESPSDFFGRIQAYQARSNDAFVTDKTFDTKICGMCSKANGAATKQCPCGNKLSLSQTASAVKSRADRAKRKAAVLAKSHDKCGICLGSLSKGNKDLGISLCTTSTTRGNGSVSNRLNPCGRAMHFKCLEKQCAKSKERQGDLGLVPNKCAHCNCKTKSPHFIEIYIPRK